MSAQIRTKAPIRARNQAAFEAAALGRRTMSWRPSRGGPNVELAYSLEEIRARSRDAHRNNVWIARGTNLIVSNEVGTGIIPISRCGNEGFRLAANGLWAKWVKEADADGVLDFNGLLSLMSRGRIEAGEMFMRFRPRRPADGLSVPLQVQVMEPDFCPHTYYLPEKDGRVTRMGIEFDMVGRRRAYWMHKAHPGEREGSVNSGELLGVPAQSVLHHYMPMRGGQLRGYPWSTQALIKSKDFDEYDDAELLRKKNRAAYTGVIRRPSYDESDYLFDPFTGEELVVDAKGVAQMNVEPGSMPSMLPGEDVTLFEGDPTGQGYADFCRQQLLGVAAGYGVPYELLSGDMSRVNDRIMRVILNEFHRLIEQWQWLLTIPQVCVPVWTRWMEAAVLSGALDAPDFDENRDDYLACEWRTMGWPYIHPVQDVQAKAQAVKEGFTSRTAVVAETGWDVEDVDRQNADDKARAEALDLVYGADAAAQVAASQNDPQASNQVAVQDPHEIATRVSELVTNALRAHAPPAAPALPPKVEITLATKPAAYNIVRNAENTGWVMESQDE